MTIMPPSKLSTQKGDGPENRLARFLIFPYLFVSREIWEFIMGCKASIFTCSEVDLLGNDLELHLGILSNRGSV